MNTNLTIESLKEEVATLERCYEDAVCLAASYKKKYEDLKATRAQAEAEVASGRIRTMTNAEPSKSFRVQYKSAVITRDNMRTDILYVNPDGICWYTPDGIGVIYLYSDDEDQIPMTISEAKHEVGQADWLFYLSEYPKMY